MAAAARLDLGFLIRREHILVVAQQLALEAALVQVQNTAGLGREVRGPREDPRMVPPRLLMASSASQRPSVVVETASTSPLPMTSVRNS
jgi:hypothetical protein